MLISFLSSYDWYLTLRTYVTCSRLVRQTWFSPRQLSVLKRWALCSFHSCILILILLFTSMFSHPRFSFLYFFIPLRFQPLSTWLQVRLSVVQQAERISLLVSNIPDTFHQSVTSQIHFTSQWHSRYISPAMMEALIKIISFHGFIHRDPLWLSSSWVQGSPSWDSFRRRA